MKKMLRGSILIMMLMYNVFPLGQVIYAEIQSESVPVEQTTQKTAPSLSEVSTSSSSSSVQPSTESPTQQSQSTSSDRKATNQSTAPTTQSKIDQPAKVSPQISSAITPSDESNTKLKERPVILQAAKEPTPKITIDFVNEQLTGFDSAGRYELAFGQRIESVSGNATFSITNDMMSKVWKIKKLGNGTTTEDSDQQQLTIPGRAQLPEDWIQAFDETVQGKNDGYLLGVNSEREYRLSGAGSWNKGYGSGRIENLSPGTYEIRTANGHQFVSPIVKKTINAGLPQHQTPTITIDFEKELLKGFDSNGNYKLYFGSENKDVSGQTEVKLSEDMFGKGWEIVQIGEDGVIQDSEGQRLTINHRTIIHDQIIKAIPESAQGENDGQIEGVDPNMSYRKVGSNDWLLGPPDRVAKNLEPGEYEMCYLGSNVAQKFASKLVKRTVEAGLPREATPAVTIDYEAEKLLGFDENSKYEVNFGSGKKEIAHQTELKITEEMFGTGGTIVKKGDGINTQNSKAQSLTIKWRQTLLENHVTAIDESAKGENDGKLQGINLDREYRKKGDTDWIKGAQNSTVENLAPGEYEIRYFGSNQTQKFASLIITKTINAGLLREATPTVTIDYEAEKLLGFDENSKYEVNFGSGKKEIANQTELKITEEMFGTGGTIVKKGDGINTQNSKAQSLTIKWRQTLLENHVTAIDESAKGENDGKLQGVNLEREYRKKGDTNWIKGTSNSTVENLAPGEYEIRYFGSNKTQEFASLFITKTIKAGLPREATPAITIDYEAEKLLGFDEQSKYEINFGTTKKEVEGQTEFKITEEMFGKGWTIVRLGDGTNTQNSKGQNITIKWRQTLLENHVIAVNESAKGENDGKLKGINLEREYRKKGDTNWIKGTSNSTVENLAPGEYEIRYFGNNKTREFASLIITKTIKAGLPREATPAVTIDYEAEKLLGFDEQSKYEINFGTTKKEVDGQTEFKITEEMFGKGWTIVRLGDGTNTQNSEGQDITIKWRQTLLENHVIAVDESAKGENDGKLKGINLEREYRKKGDTNWIKGTSNSTVENLAPGEYEIRYFGSNQTQKFASLIITKTINAGLQRETTPSATIDYETEKLLGFDKQSKYEMNHGSIKKEVTGQTEFEITEEMFGKVWTIVKKGDGTTTQNSKAQSLSIPWRQNLYPNMVKAIDESAKGENDGKLQGVSLVQEYRKKGDTNWTKGAQNSTVENLTPGEYEIRYFGSNQTQKFASLIITKTINAGLPREETPAIKIDYEKEKLTGFLADAKYKLFLGNTIIEIENQAEITITEEMMSDQEWQIIRKAQDSTKLDSAPQLLTIPKRQAIPDDNIKSVDESILGKKDGQLQGVLSTMEYRLIGTTEWIVGTESGVIANLASGNYEIRYRGSNSLQTFHGITLKRTIKQGTPETEQNYTATFESNGGSVVESQKVKSGSPIKEPKNPTREGYKFIGWYAEKELVSIWDFSILITEDIVLYAKWEKDPERTIPTSPNAKDNHSSVDKQSTPVGGQSTESGTKKTTPKSTTQNQTGKKYPQANDSTSNTHWVGFGLLIILGIVVLKRRRLKSE